MAFNFNLETSKSVVFLVDDLILRAAKIGASDIHIDPRQSDVRIRFRVDGVLHDVCSLSKAIYGEFVARIKIISGLRIDERIVPQDGRLTFGNMLDLRITIVASYYGESIVMRLLSRTAVAHTLSKLGFEDRDQVKILNTFSNRCGLVLVTGPTGSGKTTTLYSLLSMVAESYLIGATLQLVISQRLIRRLCEYCKKSIAIGVKESVLIKKHLPDLNCDLAKLYFAEGCEKCNGTGYFGRTVIAEILPINDLLRDMIIEKKSISMLRKTAADFGLSPINYQACLKFFNGYTSYDETIKAIHK